MSKVTLRELQSEALRVFGEQAFACDGVERGTAVVMTRRATYAEGGERLTFRSKTWMSARRLALACLRAMQPVEVKP